MPSCSERPTELSAGGLGHKHRKEWKVRREGRAVGMPHLVGSLTRRYLSMAMASRDRMEALVNTTSRQHISRQL